MEFEQTAIPGCFSIKAKVLGDERGRLAKSYISQEFERSGLPTDWREELHSSSRRGVVRGMHFQVPPAGQAKLIFCVVGEVIDVILDLRAGSPTFGQHCAFELRAEEGTGVFVPTGCAHGFAALGETNILFYKMTAAYSPAHDRGVALESFGYPWPFAEPIVSVRDRQHPTVADFASPFVFDEAAPAR